MPRIPRHDAELMREAGSAIEEICQQRSLSQAELADRSGLTASAISMIFSGHRRPTEATLEKLANGVGLTIDNLYERARDALRRRELLVESSVPFLATGPFLDGIIFKQAAETVWPDLARKGQIVTVEPWRDLSTQVHSPEPSFMFALANLDFAQYPPKTMPRASKLLVFRGWQLELDPCFSLITALHDSRTFKTYSERDRTNKTTGQQLAEVARELLVGKIVLVEPHTDMRANVDVLLDFINSKQQTPLVSVDEVDWRQRFDWPELGPREVVVVECSTASRALELLASGLLRENVIAVGGTAQRIAAQVAGPQPKLLVGFDDSAIQLHLGKEAYFTKRWMKKWYRPINGIVANAAALEGRNVDLATATDALNELFIATEKLLSNPAALAAEISDDYRRYGGAGWMLHSSNLVRVLKCFRIESKGRPWLEDVQIEPTLTNNS